MNITDLLRQSWQITFKNWPLWALTLIMFMAFVPSALLSGGFAAGIATLTLPFPGSPPDWMIQLRQWPLWAWLIIAAVTLLVTVATAAVTWLLQAATMRGAVSAAERGRMDLGEALRLGRQRVISIVTLSLTFGLIIAGLGLLPSVLHLTLARFAPELGLALLQSTQAVITPLLSVAGIALLLVMMSIALEDLRPRAAFRQAWRVFRSGWWGFLLVFGLTFIASLALAILAIPFLIVPIVALVFDQTAGLILTLCACVVGGPVGLALMLFSAVYTLVLYTLIYRASAPTASAGGPATGSAS